MSVVKATDEEKKITEKSQITGTNFLRIRIKMALSKTQTKRLGGILSVMFKETVPENHVQDLQKDGFVEIAENKVSLTKKGLDEKNRLCTLAGLNIKYASEKESPEASNLASKDNKDTK